MPAIAPLVISASRATDIPAFHAKWLMNRLRDGYCLWENPFNSSQRQHVSFEKCRAFVFWSKNPLGIMPFLSEIADRGYQFYFQYTLNDYEHEGLEPNIPALSRRIAAFQKLSELIGRRRVVWRFDPIILGGSLTVETVLNRIQFLARQLAPYTEKLVFSFLDFYRKTENNLKKIAPQARPPDNAEMRQLASGIAEINNGIPSPLALATCAEKIDLDRLGIKRNRCVDPELLLGLCPGDAEMRRAYAGASDLEYGNLLRPALASNSLYPKDSGQREFCGCVPSKDIGRYNTCMHLCAYCYANQSKNAVLKNLNTANHYRE